MMFQGDLRTHLDSIFTIDPELAINAISTLVLDTLAGYETGTEVKWNDAELAIYLVYIFGEVNKCEQVMCTIIPIADLFL